MGKYSVELNKLTNIPYILSLPAVNSEPVMEEEDLAATNKEDELESKSASEHAEALKRVKCMRDETSDGDDDESAEDEDEDEEGLRPQRRRKLLWA